MAESDWSNAENDLIVADYFDMLALDIAGQAYNKAERNRNLQPLLTVRSRGSVEFKHQNISAVLLGLGEPWIIGYKPASRFQLSLVDAVCRRLETKSPWHLPSVRHYQPGKNLANAVREPSPLRLDMPPTLKNAPSPIEPQFMAMIARKYDVAERDARNRELGRAGEECVLNYENNLLRDSGRHDLAKQIRWTSRDDGDGAGYDIASFEPDGKPRLIEVKTTNGWERTPFHISRNELAVADQLRDNWCLVRLWNFAREPKAFEIRPPLDAHVTLTPTSFLASIQ